MKDLIIFFAGVLFVVSLIVIPIFIFLTKSVEKTKKKFDEIKEEREKRNERIEKTTELEKNILKWELVKLILGLKSFLRIREYLKSKISEMKNQ